MSTTIRSVVFGALALLVAAAGIYGLIAYAVVRCRREIGIRLAVGAQRSDVLALFVKDVIVLVGIGLVAGIPLALATGRHFGNGSGFAWMVMREALLMLGVGGQIEPSCGRWSV